MKKIIAKAITVSGTLTTFLSLFLIDENNLVLASGVILIGIGSALSINIKEVIDNDIKILNGGDNIW